MNKIIALCFLRVFSAAAFAEEPGAPGYHVAARIGLPGDGFWDYLLVDDKSRRLFVAHGDQVLVLETDHGILLSAMTGLKGVHGVALAGGKGFISDGKDDSIDVFDPATSKVVKEIKAGKNPDAILFDPASGKVFAFNGGSGSATVIDPAKEAVAGAIPLGGKPEFAVADGKGSIYVNLEDKNELLKIDSKKRAVLARWKLAGCNEPTALAFDAANGRLFAGCRNQKLAVVDAATGKIVAAPAIGSGVDAAWYDPGVKLIFACNGEGTVSVIRQRSPNSYELAETVATHRGDKTCALDPRTHRLFLADADFGASPEHGRPPVMPGTFRVLVLDPNPPPR